MAIIKKHRTPAAKNSFQESLRQELAQAAGENKINQLTKLGHLRSSPPPQGITGSEENEFFNPKEIPYEEHKKKKQGNQKQNKQRPQPNVRHGGKTRKGSKSDIRGVRQQERVGGYCVSMKQSLHNYCLLYTSPSPRD